VNRKQKELTRHPPVTWIAQTGLIDRTDRVDPAIDLAAGSARVDDPYNDRPHPVHATQGRARATGQQQAGEHVPTPSMALKSYQPAPGTNRVQTASPNNT